MKPYTAYQASVNRQLAKAAEHGADAVEMGALAAQALAGLRREQRRSEDLAAELAELRAQLEGVNGDRHGSVPGPRARGGSGA